VGDGAREGWVDEDGRPVDGETFGDLRLERTAFELAFFARGAAAGGDTLGRATSPGDPR